MKWFKSYKPQLPSIESLAADELYEAEQALLKSHTRMEYAYAELAAQQARVNRLKKHIQGVNDGQTS